MDPRDIAALISIRQYCHMVYDHPGVKMTKESINALGAKITSLDNMIVENVLKMDNSVKPNAPPPMVAPEIKPVTKAPPPPAPAPPVGKPVAVEVPVAPAREVVTEVVEPNPIATTVPAARTTVRRTKIT